MRRAAAELLLCVLLAVAAAVVVPVLVLFYLADGERADIDWLLSPEKWKDGDW